MITNTFCHIRSISERTETEIWNAGVQSWDDCAGLEKTGLSPGKIDTIRRGIARSRPELERRATGYFAELLPPDQHWRLFREFRDLIAYVDIETTGMMGSAGDYITTISLYDGRSVFTYIHGENLQDFKRDIGRFKVLVTYNGKCFDVPAIERYFGIRITHAHIDLRFVLRSLGYRGGLKGCERQLGIGRDDLQDVDGYFAVILWNEFCRSGNPGALETLLAYNIEDVVNLETLLVLSYNMKTAQMPFGEAHKIDLPARPPIRFRADRELIDSLKRRFFSPW